MVRRTLVGALIAVAATLLMVASASATIPPQGKVGPNQYFNGLVNGQYGLGAPVSIQMACFGPLRPGETGHPMAGQTVEVLRPVVIVVGHTGFTGPLGNRIMAFFGPPPPLPVVTGPTPVSVTPPTTTGTVTFKHYGVVKAIPTSLVLPCSGTGHVFFVPMPFTPPMSGSIPQPSVVPVSYVGQP